MWIYSYSQYSEGANQLKAALGLTKIKNENSIFRGSKDKTVINWGSSELPNEIMKCKVINNPNSVKIASNKLLFFQRMPKDIVPDWTTDFKEAVDWVAKGNIVFARQKLTGSGGEGIVIMNDHNPDAFVKAPLYVLYVKKAAEYRVHVFDGKVIDIQRKTLKKEKAASGEPINYMVRNLENGFIFQRENIDPPKSVFDVAIKAVEIAGLDFGAVDVIFNNLKDKSFVLEINTAPGLQGQTVGSYAKKFGEYK